MTAQREEKGQERSENYECWYGFPCKFAESDCEEYSAAETAKESECILSITIHSPLKFTVHWFDDTKTEVQMDSNIEDYRNTASYYDGHTMRDGSQRKRYVKK